MSYPTYSSTTPTRFAGITEVPSDWEARRLKFAVTYNDETLPDSTEPDSEITYVDIGSVDLIQGITATETLTFEEAPSRARRIVKDGDTIISTVRTYLKAIAAIEDPPENMIVSTGFAVIRPLDFVHRRYLGYALQGVGFVDSVVANSTGVSYPAINPTTLVTIQITYPEAFTEQKQIADFLDWKTGQIDALIAKKQQLIEKLQEQRIAVITQAVTKGLNPNAPMRDSSIPWLGEVPDGWTVKRLKFIASTRYGLGEPPEYVEEGLNLIRATDVSKGRITMDGFKKIRSEDVPWERNPALTAKEIIVVRSGAYTGDSAIVPEELEGSIAGFDMVVTANDINPELLGWALLSRYLLEAQIYQARMRAAQPHLNAQELGNFVVVVPDVSKQDEIVNYIKSQTERIRLLSEKTNAAIDRLTEYRTALITAATTGKIDVREVKIPEFGA